jgi:hypothetical protein
MYVAAVEAIAVLVAPYGAQWIIDPRQARKALVASAIAGMLCLSPLIVPAQMTPQERRQFDRHEQRIQALERDTSLIRRDLQQLQDLPAGQQEIRDEVIGIRILIRERDKAFQLIITLLNAGALLAAGVWFLIRHRKPAS